jgi:hypothetical protein
MCGKFIGMEKTADGYHPENRCGINKIFKFCRHNSSLVKEEKYEFCAFRLPLHSASPSTQHIQHFKIVWWKRRRTEVK